MSDFTVLSESETLPLYAEIDRLKRERDALVEAAEGVKHYLCCLHEVPAVHRHYVRNLIAALAQVRK